MKCDMAPGVAGTIKDVHFTSCPIEFVAAGHGYINAGNFFRFVLWSNDLAAEKILEPEVSSDMILMVVSGKNMGQLPAKFPELRLHRVSIGGINGGGGPGLGIVHYHAVIIRAAHELAHIEVGHMVY
jgi:hypothetical protein